jgi:ketosteroid isomerase-like protein
MKQKMALLATLMVVGTLHAPSALSAPESGHDDAQTGIETVIKKYNALVARGASAKEVAELLYEDDLTIIGEGEKSLYPNLASFMKPLEGYLGNPTCRLALVDKIRHSGDVAAAWMLEHCEVHGNSPKEDYRVLYVFRKGTKGWRVTMEMFGAGTF